LGYDTLLITDHLAQQLAPIPAMAAALEATTRLRVGSYVFANDYRNPVMLAKEIATCDVLSGGRVEFGLGAGWYQRDYDMLGLPYDPPATRVSRMIEAAALTIGEVERKLARLRSEAGARLAEVELNIFIVDAGVTDEPRSLFDGLATRLKGVAAQLVESPFFLYGSTADLKRLLLERREQLGITYYGLPEKAMEPFAPLVRELRAA